MRVDILTVLPEMFEGPLSCSILKRAQEKGLVEIHIHNLRDFTDDRHRTTDDAPYGGGSGMVMKVEPIHRALEHLKSLRGPEGRILLMSPQGDPFHQKLAWELAAEESLTFICGHYEGIDERVREHLATDEVSIGDYVLTGGELPAMVILDAVVRLLPGTLGDEASAAGDSFAEGLLEYPQYTRPPDFLGWRVVEILLSGNHGAIARWRREQSLRRTFEKRPELLKQAELTDEERRQVARWEEAACVKEEIADVADYGGSPP